MGAGRVGGQFLIISAKCIARSLGGQLVVFLPFRLAPLSSYSRVRNFQIFGG